MRHALRTLGLLFAIPLLIVCLPLVIPYVAISQRLQDRRLARTGCPSCGVPFGTAEVARAREDGQKAGREAVSQIMALGGRPRVVVTWHLCCPNCHAQFCFDPVTDKLTPMDTAPAA